MPKANKCRVCGETNPKRWLGANRDLCSECITLCLGCNGRGSKNTVMGEMTCRFCNGRGTVAKDFVFPAPKEESKPVTDSRKALVTMALLGSMVTPPSRQVPVYVRENAEDES